MKIRLFILALISVLPVAFVTSCANSGGVNASGASASDIENRSRAALKKLYAEDPAAKTLGEQAEGILVFPEILRGGFVVSGQGGNGAFFRKNGSVAGFYQSVAASYGLEAGVQKFGYALFFMDKEAYKSLTSTAGWELGSAPNLTVLDKGTAGNLSSATIRKGTYAVFFDQRGLMGGISVQGSKISPIAPGKP